METDTTFGIYRCDQWMYDCTRTHLSTMGKDVVKQENSDFNLDELVNIYPVTPGLISKMRPKPVVAQANVALGA